MATTMLKKAQYLLGAGMLALASFPAGAGIFYSDLLTVYDVPGHVYAQVGVTDANEDPTQFYYIDDSTLVNPSQVDAPTPTVLLETDGTNNISDIFGVGTLDGTNYFLGFLSDDETGALGQGPVTDPPGTINLDEVENFYYDATMYLDPSLQVAGWTATFVSGNIHVPEPGSLALLGLGTFALGAFRRASRRT